MRITIDTDSPAPQVTIPSSAAMVAAAPEAAAAVMVLDGGAAPGTEAGADTARVSGDALNAGPAEFGGVAAPGVGAINGTSASSGAMDGGAAPDA